MTTPTNATVFYHRGAEAPVLAPPITQVCVDGRAEPRLRLDRLETVMGEAPRAHLSAGFGRDLAGQDLRLEDLAGRLNPGQQVTVTLLRGGLLPGAAGADLVLFDGRVAAIEMGLEPEGESLRLEAEDPAAAWLRRRVSGQRAWTAGGEAERVDGLPLVFNPDGRPNASTASYDPGTGDGVAVFAPDGGPDAAPWTVAEAAAYLAAEHGASADVDVPGPSEWRAALPALIIRDVSLEGRTLAEAMAALLDLAGARLVATAEPGPAGVSRRIEIWYPYRAPTGWLAHQRPGERFAPGATQLAGLTLRIDFGAAPRRYVARGDLKLYESTFDLVAAWDDSLAEGDADRYSPSANPDFAAVRDVFRKWALNETGAYAAEPFNRGPAPPLAALFDGAPTVLRRRRLRPCLSRDGLGRSHGVYAEVSLDEGGTWERLSLAARVLTDEAGLVLTDDPLPPRYLAAAMRGRVRMRVTASLESDARLAAEFAGDADPALPGRTRHLSAPAGYRFRRVASASRFYGQAGADEADDADRLTDLVRAAWTADHRTPAASRIDVPYLAFGHRVGERVLGLRGRRIDLARLHDGYAAAPVVRRVVHTFAPLPRTQLELE